MRGFGGFRSLDAIMITPGEFGSFVKGINVAVLELLEDMIEQESPVLDAYSRWVNGVWSPFFQVNESAFETITGSAFAATYERAEQLRIEYEAFRTKFEQAGGSASAPAPEGAIEGTDWAALAWAGLIVVGLFGAGYLLSKIPSRRALPELERKTAETTETTASEVG